MQIIIAKSKKADKKYDAIVDDKKRLVLEPKDILISLSIKIRHGKNDTSKGIGRMRTGLTRRQLVSMLNIFFGIGRRSRNPLRISTNDSKMYTSN